MNPIVASMRGPQGVRGAHWDDFTALLETLVERSCCGGHGAGPVVHARPPRFASLGRLAWEATIAAAPPRVVVRRGPMLLPEVTLAAPGQALRPGVDVVIDGERIAAIAPTGAIERRDAVVIEDARGLVVAPALVDMHVHMPPANALALTPLFLLLNLRHGVVRVRDAGDVDGTATPAALALVASGALPGPELHYAYAFVGTGRSRWANALLMDRPDHADAIVAQLAHVGARWVKCYENLDAACIRALTDAAGARGIQIMGHVPTGLRLEDAAIFDAQHGFGVPEPATLPRDHVLDRAIVWESVTPARIAAVVDACVARGMAMTPTLSSSKNLLRLEHHATERFASDARLLPQLYAEVVWHPRIGLPAYRGMTAEQFARARDAYARKLALVGALAAADVTLHLGTDTQQPFVVPGVAIHDELAAFEAAGIARAAAWRMASEGAARSLGVPDSGRLEVGARADLVVSGTDPLVPGWRPDAVRAVIAGGALVWAAALDEAIGTERARFEGAAAGFVSRWLTRAALHRAARRFAS